MALFFECVLQCAQKVLDAADIVRDGDLSIVTIPGTQSEPGTAFQLPSRPTYRARNMVVCVARGFHLLRGSAGGARVVSGFFP